MKEMTAEVPGAEPSYAEALAGARRTAELGDDAMLLAWYDGIHGQGYPDVPECTPGQEGWEAYAANRGANVAVTVNGGAYRFLFLAPDSRG